MSLVTLKLVKLSMPIVSSAVTEQSMDNLF